MREDAGCAATGGVSFNWFSGCALAGVVILEIVESLGGCLFEGTVGEGGFGGCLFESTGGEGSFDSEE